MHCHHCGRAIRASAVPGASVGPVCAARLGLLVRKECKPQIFTLGRARAAKPNPAQMELIDPAGILG